MHTPRVPVENAAEIGWGALLVLYLLGAGRPEFLRPAVLAVFGLSAAVAFLELYLRRIQWRWLYVYDVGLWTIMLSAMVAVTGGRSSELWPAYLLMSLTAPSLDRPTLHNGLMAVNSLLYAVIYTWVNPDGAPFVLPLLVLRMGLFFLVSYVVDRSMARERHALEQAVKATRDRVAELVGARDAERRRIAGDLHDWLGTGVVAPMRKLELALRAKEPEAMEARVQEALAIISRSHGELRRLMENLHPHLLEQMGLGAALQAYVQQWGEEHGIAAAFQGDTAPEPPADVAVALYRIMQEALNNVLKHADARRVEVRLTLRTGEAALSIADDGQGFAVAQSGPGGRGLAGMAERAAVLGGQTIVSSRPGAGTRVAVRIPYRPQP